MRNSSTGLALVAATFIGVSAASSVSAAPMSVAGAEIVTPASQITDVRYRRHYVVRRHRGVGPAAVLGLFGALAGAAIASNRYDDGYYYGGYPAYGYGYPAYGYGYPAYSYGYGYPAYGYRNRGYYRGPRYGAYRGAYRGGVRSPNWR